MWYPVANRTASTGSSCRHGGMLGSHGDRIGEWCGGREGEPAGCEKACVGHKSIRGRTKTGYFFCTAKPCGHHITSHHIASHRIASHRIASHRITPHRIPPHRITHADAQTPDTHANLHSQKSVGLGNTLRPSKSACSKTQTSVRIRRSVTSVQTTVRVSGRVVPLSTSERNSITHR